MKLRSGADPNERDKQHPKYTPLHRATSGGNQHAVRLLLQAEADVLMRDRLGFSALHFAANQSAGIVSDLLLARCDVNAANLQQMTPLHSAAGMGRIDICEVLLDAGASSSAGVASPADLARRAAERRSGADREACLNLAEQLARKGEVPLKRQWFYQSQPIEFADSRSVEWLPFETQASDLLEAAYLRGDEQVEIESSASTSSTSSTSSTYSSKLCSSWKVDLKAGIQMNSVTGSTRRVHRGSQTSSPWVPAAPAHWAGLVSTGAQKLRLPS
eukprot:Skav210442  [mRNA]  locus=scaffold1297:111482:112300:+ [translate_table: standard]